MLTTTLYWKLLIWYLVHSPEKIAETIQVGLYDTIGGLLKSEDDMCRTLSSEIFSVMCTHNIGRRASIRFIPNLASLFNGKMCCILDDYIKLLSVYMTYNISSSLFSTVLALSYRL